MSNQTARTTRSLFVISGDYGELVVAMTLLRGQELAAGATLLLPKAMHALNEGSLPIPSRAYESIEDIVSVLEDRPIDLLFLCSGYLFSNNNLLSRRALAELIRRARSMGCRVATSDPFLGLAPRLTASHMDPQLPKTPWTPILKRINSWIIARDVVKVSRLLEEFPHLYPSPIPYGLENNLREGYFNPRLLAHEGEWDDGWVTSDVRSNGESPRWLFVLGSLDLNVQQNVCGADNFFHLVRGKLKQTVEAGRRPVVIAPPSFGLKGRLPSEWQVELVPHCAFPTFLAHLLRAEYAFYWNAFSCSVMARAVRRLPVFFFDPGHMPRVIKPYHAIGAQFFFPGWQRVYLDVRKELSLPSLSNSAEGQASQLTSVVDRLRHLQTPDQMVDRWISAST